MLLALALYAWPTVLAIHAEDPEPEAAPSPSVEQSIDVVASDFSFSPRTFTATAGPASFSVRNSGVVEHDFVILDAQRQRLGGTEPLAPGATGLFAATLSPGTYVVICTLPGHFEIGMTGELTVTA
jgi:uncharacterized cupredoxin-like copper-binding protein